ncbi:MAG TPA: Holliday junction branch migration protein RuvA [Acidimicrobiales bacterium]|nr:Holliday junction branch migration protein RuvA [Acidimicrobiales bacterium]
MIGSLRGTLLDRRARPAGGIEVLVETGGVGYRAVVPVGPAAGLGAVGSTVFLHIHTHVREDAIVLFGFPTREERVCFEALIGAHGVGPAVALALLSVHSPAALQRAVMSDDIDALTLVPGIGRKTAARLIVELKSKLEADLDGTGLEVVTLNGNGHGPPDPAAAVRADVRNALAALGYGADEIRQALVGLPADGTVEDHLRLALRDLATAR